MIKNCVICNVEFEANRLKKTCSEICSKELRKTTQRKIRENNKEGERERNKKWITKNPNRKIELFKLARTDLNKRIRFICNAAKTRAKISSREYNITPEYVLKLVEKQNGKCKVTNIEFDLTTNNEYYRNPLGPSLDRINNKFGYIEGNVQIVCNFYNAMKSEWNEQDFKRFLKAAYDGIFNS